LNILDDIQIKLEKHKSQYNYLVLLLSLKCFLINHYECHWYIFTNQLEDQEKLNENQKLSFYYFKDLNEKNIQSLHIKPIELLIMPKNKRLELLKIVESKIEDLTYDQIIIIDSYRTDPFQQDILFDYVIDNSFFDNETKKIYSKRHEDGNKLIDFAKISDEYYESALNISRQNKIKDYWKNIWGISNNYNDPTIIENLILK
jgi:hypothetical protein